MEGEGDDGQAGLHTPGEEGGEGTSTGSCAGPLELMEEKAQKIN